MRHLTSILFAAGLVLLAQPPRPADDPAAAIRAAQKKIDTEYARSVMSPFTAVAVRYFEPGQTERLGADAAGAAFGADAPAGDAVDLSFEGGAFWIAPVSPARVPVVLRKGADGDVDRSSARPVKAKSRIADGEIVGLGRYLVETFASPTAGHARAFDPESPARKHFTGLKWFPPNPALRVRARFAASASPDKVVIATSRGLRKDYYTVGRFTFVVEGASQALTALSVSPAPKAGDELFVAFRDATTGKESYEVGRYLFPKFERADSTYVIDFNAATNPLCNYSPHYNCPIPPRENVLTVPIRAGEMAYPHRDRE